MVADCFTRIRASVPPLPRYTVFERCSLLRGAEKRTAYDPSAPVTGVTVSQSNVVPSATSGRRALSLAVSTTHQFSGELVALAATSTILVVSSSVTISSLRLNTW